MSGLSVPLNSSDRNAGSPITMLAQGAMFQILSHTYNIRRTGMTDNLIIHLQLLGCRFSKKVSKCKLIEN
jgi:hypothetical protein